MQSTPQLLPHLALRTFLGVITIYDLATIVVECVPPMFRMTHLVLT